MRLSVRSRRLRVSFAKGHAFLPYALRDIACKMQRMELVLEALVARATVEREDKRASDQWIAGRVEDLQAAIYDIELANARGVLGDTRLGTDDRDRLAYADLVRAVREAVLGELASGWQAAVVSQGDDALLNLYGRPASHFPRTEDGFHAGRNPTDGAEATADLKRWRKAGVVLGDTQHRVLVV